MTLLALVQRLLELTAAKRATLEILQDAAHELIPDEVAIAAAQFDWDTQNNDIPPEFWADFGHYPAPMRAVFRDEESMSWIWEQVEFLTGVIPETEERRLLTLFVKLLSFKSMDVMAPDEAMEKGLEPWTVETIQRRTAGGRL